ncbi:uncharacterized protein DNG_09149 [Cephalotrichum gorgonifer]|uniref:Glutathione S-transferase n=1 Tax=Cephalotrichum gorgonifer TaxID=2041049 RepID=A0AAE8N6D0_9PEZI|nr:uncharacterized protein DNG_09149 [Cephalotrichum gorgonifer]
MATPPPLTLYSCKGSCAFIPHAILAHAGVPFSLVMMKQAPDGNRTNSRLEAADGSLSHEAFLTINPRGYVPTLVVGSGPDAEIITELPAVVTYVASVAADQGHNLLGAPDHLTRARIAEWLAWTSGTLLMTGFAAMWRPGRFADDSDAATMENVKRRGSEVVSKSFATIDGKLAGKHFAVGDGLTVVDFALYLYWWWWDDEPDVETRFPNYAHDSSQYHLYYPKTSNINPILGPYRWDFVYDPDLSNTFYTFSQERGFFDPISPGAFRTNSPGSFEHARGIL